MCPHGNCATACCAIALSGPMAAKVVMYWMFRGDRPFMSGNSLRKSSESRLITPLPQPCRSCWNLTLWPIAVELDELSINGPKRLGPGRLDCRFQVLEEIHIADGQVHAVRVGHHPTLMRPKTRLIPIVQTLSGQLGWR